MVRIETGETLHFSDAAQLNRPDGSDTGGYVTAISTSRILERKEARTSILDFHSFKLERAVKASNGAEGQAVFETEDKGWTCRVFWSLLNGEKLNRTNADELAAMNESLLIMDSRGCYDASDSPLPGRNNAKTGVEMLSVKRAVRDGSNCFLRWPPSDMNIADAMAKVSPDAFKVYALWQQRKTWIVRFDEEFVSARKQQKLRRAKMEENKSKESCLERWPEEELEYHDSWWIELMAASRIDAFVRTMAMQLWSCKDTACICWVSKKPSVRVSTQLGPMFVAKGEQV